MHVKDEGREDGEWEVKELTGEPNFSTLVTVRDYTLY